MTRGERARTATIAIASRTSAISWSRVRRVDGSPIGGSVVHVPSVCAGAPRGNAPTDGSSLLRSV